MSNPNNINNNWVMIVAFMALLLPIIIIEFSVLTYTHGNWSYPIEDPYIHMSIAKNLALHHVWGTSQYEFTSASSSILYPLILAFIFLLTGPHTCIPFIINLVSAILIILLLKKWLKAHEISIRSQIVTYLSVIFITPLSVVTILGMEHTLHLLISLLFVYNFSNNLSQTYFNNNNLSRLNWKTYVYGMLLTSIRFEGLFLILVACIVLLWKHQIKNSILLGIISTLPVLIFGIISLSKGSYFFPNSVLLKSPDVPLNLYSFAVFITDGIWQKLYFGGFNWSQIATSKLILVLPLSYLLYVSSITGKPFYGIMVFLLIATVIIHICFGRVGWFFRYEAYLIGLVTITTCVMLSQIPIDWSFVNWNLHKTIIGAIALYIFMPFFFRSWDAIDFTDNACKYTYDQNYLISKFLHKYYDTTNTAINDLGAMTYYTHARDLDLDGLGSIEIAKSLKENYNTPEFVDKIITDKKIKIAVIFERLAPPLLQDKWKKIASWHSPNHINHVNTDFQFYAIDTTYATSLRENLIAYSQTVPRNIVITIY